MSEREREGGIEGGRGGKTVAFGSGFGSNPCQVCWNFLMDSEALPCSPKFSFLLLVFRNLHALTAVLLDRTIYRPHKLQ
jgi:hypothetical protein